jgi:hypothetical protein
MDRAVAQALLLIRERSGELGALREIVRSMAAPLYWYDPDTPGSPILGNGTACFVSTGTRELMVTCDHVYSGWVSHRNENSRLVCQIGGAVVEPERHLIDRDQGLDLATFEIGQATRAMVGANLHAVRMWPPRVAERDLVMAGGFPGTGRSQSAATPVNKAHFLFPTYARIVDRVHEDNIGMQLEIAEAFSPQGLIPTPNPDLGGASGGPVVRLNPESDLLPVELVGFIYEYHAGFELLYARPASLIDEAGRICGRPA